MINQSSSTPNKNKEVIIHPSYRLPIFISISGLTLLPLHIGPWPSIIISSFGFFLLLQSFTLRLKLSKEDLIVLQLGKELRRFPFKYWIAWKIFLPKLPGLFYFREEASPHLLPMLFNPESLENELRVRVGELEIKKE